MWASASPADIVNRSFARLSDNGRPICFAASLITDAFNSACLAKPMAAESMAVGSPDFKALTRFKPLAASLALELFVNDEADNAAPVKSPLPRAEATAAYCTGRIKSSGIVTPICGEMLTNDPIIPCKFFLSKAYKSCTPCCAVVIALALAASQFAAELSTPAAM